MTVKEFYLEEEKTEHVYIALDTPNEDIAITPVQELEEPVKVSDNNPLHQDIGDLWHNWYSDNSINLLLYLGAFLIVAAASIFVGFQWDTLSGIVKAVVLTALAAAFFVSGLWFQSIPKIKTAGTTFIGIGSLLIPICGTGWYNFILKDLNFTGGAVWLTTSLVSLITYAYLAYRFKNRFFVYTSSLATISLSLAFINIAGLNKEMYILASMSGSFILLLGGLVARKTKEQKGLIGLPLEISANIVMPASLAYGLYAAVQANSLFTIEAAAGVFVAALFYLVAYFNNKNAVCLLASQILLPAGITLLFQYLKIPNTYLLYALDFIAMLYLYVAYLMKNDKLHEEADTNLLSGSMLSVIVFVLAVTFRVNVWELYLFSLIPVFSGAALAFIRKDLRLVYLSTVFIIISTWVLTMKALDFSTHPQFLAHIMTSLGVVFFGIAMWRKEEKMEDFFTVNTILFFATSVVVANVNLTTQAITFGIGSILFLAYYLIQKKEQALYGMAAALNISVFFLLPSYKVKAPLEYYPIIFSALSMVFYGSSFLFEKASNTLRTIGIVNQVATTGFSLILYGQNNTPTLLGYNGYKTINGVLNMTTLSTAYILTVLTGWDASVRRKANMDYLASAFAIGTYIWQVYYFTITETLYYTIPVGIYFLILGFIRESGHHDKDNANILNLIGCGTLIVPTFFLAQVNSGYFYAVTVGILGIILLSLGISIKNRIYEFSGAAGVILAIIPQTFQYLLALPKWLVVGIAGLSFVVVAIFLLLKRDENKR